METLEIHPITQRIMCLNHQYLKPWWITHSLSKALGCFYNHHQPQVIWQEINCEVPKPKIFKIKGHTSTVLHSNIATKCSIDAQMGTYLVFCIPEISQNWISCELILNGIESIKKSGENPSKFVLELVNQSTKSPFNKILNGNSSANNRSHNQSISDEINQLNLRNKINDFEAVQDQTSNDKLIGDFSECENIISILEDNETTMKEEVELDSDEIYKIVQKRLTVNIRPFLKEWQERKETLLVLFIRPDQRNQAWQFLSSWLSIKSATEEVNSTTLSRKKCVTRTKASIPPNLK